MEQNNENLGTWQAVVKTDGKAPSLTVNGTFPINGEKPIFSLKERIPRGTNQNILILELSFGDRVNADGTSTASITPFEKTLGSTDQYTSVYIIDPADRRIAEVEVITE